jgi:hypothetical protein
MEPKSEDLYWAAIVRHRWWSWIDGPELSLWQEREGFDGAAVLRVAGAYSVRRGLNLPGGDAAPLAKHLNVELRRLPDDLLKRAEQLDALAQSIADFTHKTQISAVSKFAWFAKPDGWTVFDRDASRALGTREHLAFYRKLKTLGFAETVKKLADVLARNNLAEICAERVIDQYLLLRRRENSKSIRELARGYLNILPENLAGSLREAAGQIENAIRGDRIIQESI